MSAIHVPAGLPMLRKGVGDTPADGGCLVQIASYLHDGRSWSDETPCVHPVLRRLAIYVNDAVSDEVRSLLAPLAADLVGTGPGPTGLDGKVLNVRLAVWAARRVEHLVRKQDREVCHAAVAAADAWANRPSRANAVNAANAAAYAANAANAVANAAANAAGARDQALIGLLRDAISEHRRLTGQDKHAADAGRWQQVCELIGTTP